MPHGARLIEGGVRAHVEKNTFLEGASLILLCISKIPTLHHAPQGDVI